MPPEELIIKLFPSVSVLVIGDWDRLALSYILFPIKLPGFINECSHSSRFLQINSIIDSSFIELICFQSSDFCEFWEYQVRCTSDSTDLHILWQLRELYILKSSELVLATPSLSTNKYQTGSHKSWLGFVRIVSHYCIQVSSLGIYNDKQLTEHTSPRQCFFIIYCFS